MCWNRFAFFKFLFVPILINSSIKNNMLLVKITMYVILLCTRNILLCHLQDIKLATLFFNISDWKTHVSWAKAWALKFQQWTEEIWACIGAAVGCHDKMREAFSTMNHVCVKGSDTFQFRKVGRPNFVNRKCFPTQLVVLWSNTNLMVGNIYCTRFWRQVFSTCMHIYTVSVW